MNNEKIYNAIIAGLNLTTEIIKAKTVKSELFTDKTGTVEAIANDKNFATLKIHQKQKDFFIKFKAENKKLILDWNDTELKLTEVNDYERSESTLTLTADAKDILEKFFAETKRALTANFSYLKGGVKSSKDRRSQNAKIQLNQNAKSGGCLDSHRCNC